MGFYNRSSYRFNNVEVPHCFIELEEYLSNLSLNHRFSSITEHIAENICRRMADVDLYSYLICQALTEQDLFDGAIKVGSFLVSYFGACKSLMDAGSVSLTEIYKLPLSYKEQDFSKGKFWNELNSNQPKVFKRYIQFKRLCPDVVKWRDIAVHRITPLVMVLSPGNFDSTPQENMEIKMVATPDKTITTLIMERNPPEWIHPLELHYKWRPEFIKLCNELCRDVRENI